MSYHRATRSCCFCPTSDLDDGSLSEHLHQAHPNAVRWGQLDTLIDSCARHVTTSSLATCQFCDDWSGNLADAGHGATPTRLRKHLGRHLESMALFVLPSIEEGDPNDAGSISDVASAASLRSRTSVDDIAQIPAETRRSKENRLSEDEVSDEPMWSGVELMRRRLERSMEEESYTCNICDKVNNRYVVVSQHGERLTGSRSTTLQTRRCCCKFFALDRHTHPILITLARSHFTRRHPEVKHLCDWCFAGFHVKDDLTKHLQQHILKKISVSIERLISVPGDVSDIAPELGAQDSGRGRESE